MSLKNLIIGLVGPQGSGKTSVAKILKKRGFKGVILSSFIKEKLEKKGLKIDRKSLQDMGDQLRKTKGPDVLARLALRKIKSQKIDKAIIDGIRNIAEVERLKKEANFYLLGVTATPDKRFKRLTKNSDKYNNIKTWDDFVFYSLRDEAGLRKKHGQQNRVCYLNAQHFISNNAGLKSLENKVLRLLKKINKESLSS